MQSVHDFFFPILTKISMCRQISGNILGFKFHKNLFSGSRLVTCGQTDRHKVIRTFFKLPCEHTYNIIKRPGFKLKFISTSHPPLQKTNYFRSLVYDVRYRCQTHRMHSSYLCPYNVEGTFLTVLKYNIWES
jgi:hypothetical protein